MNEHIRELARLTGGYYTSKTDPTFEGFDFSPEQLEKFVELIVLECIELCEQVRSKSVSNGSDEYNHGREMGAEICRNKIFQTFRS